MKATDINSKWVSTLRWIVEHGQNVTTRGHDTLEILNNTITIDMRRPVLTVAARKLGYKFLTAEAAWILSGDDRVASIVEYAPAIEEFSDDGKTFFGAYGPKIVEQIEYVIKVLKKDPTTRQAVINIWRENPNESKDIPCTLSCQFLVREGRLQTIVTMRSSDIWLGVPYDMFNFTMLSAFILLETELPVKLGYLHNNAASRHLYKKDIKRAIDVLAQPLDEKFKYYDFHHDRYSSGQHLIDELWNFANNDKTSKNWARLWLADVHEE